MSKSIDYKHNKRVFIVVSITMALIVLAVMGIVWYAFSTLDDKYGTQDNPLIPQEVVDNNDYYTSGSLVFVQGNITSIKSNGLWLNNTLFVHMSELELGYFSAGQTVLYEIEMGSNGDWTLVKNYSIV